MQQGRIFFIHTIPVNMYFKCLFVNFLVYLSVGLDDCMIVCLQTCMLIGLSVRLSLCLSICIGMSDHHFVRSSVGMYL